MKKIDSYEADRLIIKRSSKRGLLFLAFCLNFLTGTCLSYFGSKFWIFDNISHFRIHFFLLSILSLMVIEVYSLVLGNGVITVCLQMILFIASICSIMHFIVYFLHNQNVYNSSNFEASDKVYSLASWNILFKNEKKQAVTDKILEKDYDFVVLSEVDSAWFEHIKNTLQTNYKTILRSAGSGRSDVTILSKYRHMQKEPLAVRGNQSGLKVVFELDNKTKLSLYGIHPYSPMSKRHWTLRNEYFQYVGKLVRKDKNPVIIAGDFNTSVWSLHILDFMKKYNINFARGLWGTFPKKIGLFGINIDHIAHNKFVATRWKKYDSIPGSDHNGVNTVFVTK